MTKGMTVLEYLERYGDMEIIDKENRKTFWSNPELRMIGGVLNAGDFRRLGIF